MRFSVGVDLGQQRDHSAIVVVERDAAGRRLVRSAARVPLGTPYPLVVARVRETVQHEELWGCCALAVDGTGVGRPVVEMLREAGLGCEISAVSMTSGGLSGGGPGRAQGGRTPWYSVPKRDLLAGVQVLLERRELRISRAMEGVGSLARELKDMQQQVGARGKVRLGADGAGQHDDLVIALSLACWRAGRGRIGFGEGQLL